MLTKRPTSKKISSSQTRCSTVDVLGSGPAPIWLRDTHVAVASASQPACRVPFRKDVSLGTAESLLRYVDKFGQGKGTSIVVDGLTWLELQFREDRTMLISHFGELFACSEDAHGHRL